MFSLFDPLRCSVICRIPLLSAVICRISLRDTVDFTAAANTKDEPQWWPEKVLKASPKNFSNLSTIFVRSLFFKTKTRYDGL